MSELQAGMLAMIVGYRYIPENVGKIVEIAERLDDGDWRVTGDMVTRSGLKSKTSEVHPKHLLPIKPEADPLDVTHKEELHA